MRTRRRPLLLRGVSVPDDDDDEDEDESPPLLPPPLLPPRPLVLALPLVLTPLALLLPRLPGLLLEVGVFWRGTRLGCLPPVTARGGGVVAAEVDGIVF